MEQSLWSLSLSNVTPYSNSFPAPFSHRSRSLHPDYTHNSRSPMVALREVFPQHRFSILWSTGFLVVGRMVYVRNRQYSWRKQSGSVPANPVFEPSTGRLYALPKWSKQVRRLIQPLLIGTPRNCTRLKEAGQHSNLTADGFHLLDSCMKCHRIADVNGLLNPFRQLPGIREVERKRLLYDVWMVCLLHSRQILPSRLIDDGNYPADVRSAAPPATGAGRRTSLPW